MNALINKPVITLAELQGLNATQDVEIKKARLQQEKRDIEQQVTIVRNGVLKAALSSKTIFIHDTRDYLRNNGDEFIDKILEALHVVFPDVKIYKDTQFVLNTQGAVNVIKIDWT